MEQYPFYIEVTWGYWENNEYNQKQESVILMAETFTNAVGKIEENYGDELYSIEKVECISDCSTLTLPITEGRKLVQLLAQYDRGEIPVEDKEIPKEVHWNPNKTPFPYDAPLGTVIICDNSSTSAKQIENATYAQNWEGVAP